MLPTITQERAFVLAKEHAQMVADRTGRSVYVVPRTSHSALVPADWGEWFFCSLNKSNAIIAWDVIHPH